MTISGNRRFKCFPITITSFNDLTFDNVALVAEQIMNSFALHEFDRVELVYNQFKNAAVQNLTNEVFLPVDSVSAGKVKTYTC